MKSALLVIDVQQALCTGKYAVFEIDRVIEKINAMTTRARAAGAPVVLVQHEEDDGPMQFESGGWQLAPGLAVAPADVRVRKKTPDAFHQTGLQDLLAPMGVNHLVICGLQTDFCVDTTVRRALALGYPVTLAADAHSTLDNGVITASQIIAHHNRTLSSMSSFGPRVHVAPADDIQIQV